VIRLSLTRRALIDIEEIRQYSLAQWGEQVAEKYLDSIEQALQRLKDNPELLREKPDISDHFCFYRVREHFLICMHYERLIAVLAVRHGSMDLPERIAELEPQLLAEAEILHRAFVKSRRKSR